MHTSNNTPLWVYPVILLLFFAFTMNMFGDNSDELGETWLGIKWNTGEIKYDTKLIAVEPGSLLSKHKATFLLGNETITVNDDSTISLNGIVITITGIYPSRGYLRYKVS